MNMTASFHPYKRLFVKLMCVSSRKHSNKLNSHTVVEAVQMFHTHLSATNADVGECYPSTKNSRAPSQPGYFQRYFWTWPSKASRSTEAPTTSSPKARWHSAQTGRTLTLVHRVDREVTLHRSGYYFDCPISCRFAIDRRPDVTDGRTDTQARL